MSLSLPLPHLADQYLLDPDVVYLNHGSFGAVPRPVFESYQRWQKELEANPVIFLGGRLSSLLAQAREKLGAFINAAPRRSDIRPQRNLRPQHRNPLHRSERRRQSTDDRPRIRRN